MPFMDRLDRGAIRRYIPVGTAMARPVCTIACDMAGMTVTCEDWTSNPTDPLVARLGNFASGINFFTRISSVNWWYSDNCKYFVCDDGMVVYFLRLV